MKHIILALLILGIFGCKKKAVDPVTTTITKTDTVTVIKHVTDTVYCTPTSDLVQGTWYCYNVNGSSFSPSELVIFTSNQVTWSGNVTSGLTYSTDYSTVYMSGTTVIFTVFVHNCNELLIYDSLHASYILRRTP
jgi:hypothetical protein